MSRPIQPQWQGTAKLWSHQGSTRTSGDWFHGAYGSGRRGDVK